ncbi:hypothetical protein PVAG01_08916 [Phlyctema vagabunda]|uniref:Uncharacterized protein n=1 Tax=Phlyctema vagabunda TaxID=108571 RepID=A0ABR4PAV7_9HELO
MKIPRLVNHVISAHLLQFLALTDASQVGAAAPYEPPPAGVSDSQVVLNDEEFRCQVSHMPAYGGLATGDVPIFNSNLYHPIKPHFDSLNATTGEQWEFDAISADGDAGILIAFYRDPEFNFLGPGDLRINLDVTFSNGTMVSLVDYAEQSVIESCATHTTGTWFRGGAVYKFYISHNISTASVTFDAPSIRGTIELQSTAKPRCADGSTWPPPVDSVGPYDMVRGMYWMEPIPAALTSVDLQIKGSHLQFKDGFGGAERIWQSRTWFEMLEEYEFLRVSVGPYAATYWASAADGTGKAGNLLLSQNGETIFSSSLREEGIKRFLVDDYFVLSPTYGGNVRSSIGGRTETGYDLTLLSPSRERQWSFHFEHKQVLFEFNLGRGAGGSSFMGPADGGEKGGEVYHGAFLNESVNFANLWIPSFVQSALWTYHYSKASLWAGWKQAVDLVIAYQQ